MRIKSIFLLIVFIVQIFAPVGLMSSSISKSLDFFHSCSHELSSCNSKNPATDVKSCCSKKSSKDNSCIEKEDQDDKSCCGDNCDCQCCNSLHITNIQLPVESNYDIVHNAITNSRVNKFFYKNLLSNTFVLNLLNPPKFI